MNWTGGRLRRHSSNTKAAALSRVQKQNFAKPKLKTADIPREAPFHTFAQFRAFQINPDSDSQSQGAAVGDANQASVQKSEGESANQQQSSLTNAQSTPYKPTRLDRIKRHLLDKTDWAAVTASRPLQIAFTPGEELERFGKRRRLTDVDRSRLNSASIGPGYTAFQQRRRDETSFEIGTIGDIDIRIHTQHGTRLGGKDGSLPQHMSSQEMLLGPESICSNQNSQTQWTERPQNRLSQLLSPSVHLPSSFEPSTQSRSASIIPGISASNQGSKDDTPGVFGSPRLESKFQEFNGTLLPLNREDGVLQSSGLPAERRLTLNSISNPGYQCTTPGTVGNPGPGSSAGTDELQSSSNDRDRIFRFSQPPINGRFRQGHTPRPVRHDGLESERPAGTLENDLSPEERNVSHVSESPITRRFTLDDQVLAEQEGRLNIGSIVPDSQNQYCGQQDSPTAGLYTASRSPATQSQYSSWFPQPKHNIQRSETRELSGEIGFRAFGSFYHLGARRFEAKSNADNATQSVSSPVKIFGQSMVVGGAGIEHSQNRIQDARESDIQSPRVQELDTNYSPGTNQFVGCTSGRDRDSLGANGDGVPDTFWRRLS